MLYIYITIILQIRLLKRGKLYNMVVVNKIIHSQIFSFFSEESMENYAAIGIDVGGTNIKAGLVDAQGNLLSVQVVPTRKEQGSEQVLALIGEMIASLCASSARKVLGVSVALPGGVDDQAGKCLYCPNLGWKELPVREILTALTGLSVRLVNDANAACLGEYFYGKGRQARAFLSITLGTGIGSALVLQTSFTPVLSEQGLKPGIWWLSRRALYVIAAGGDVGKPSFRLRVLCGGLKKKCTRS